MKRRSFLTLIGLAPVAATATELPQREQEPLNETLFDWGQVQWMPILYAPKDGRRLTARDYGGNQAEVVFDGRNWITDYDGLMSCMSGQCFPAVYYLVRDQQLKIVSRDLG